MSRLSDIAVRIEAPTRQGGLGGGVAAVLSELVGMLERVALGGEPASIDLRSLPMSSQDRIELQRILGVGEVQVTMTADGVSSIKETSVAGVWWLLHQDKQGESIAELIEVAAIPQILVVAQEEMIASAKLLREHVAVRHEPSSRTDHATCG